MKIAIIGTGNVGGALATKWAGAGHEINLGARDLENFKGKELLQTRILPFSPLQRRFEDLKYCC